MLWADNDSKLPSNYFSALVQLKSFKHGSENDPNLKDSHSKTIQEDFSKVYIEQVDKTDFLMFKLHASGTCHTISFFTHINLARCDVFSMELQNSMANC